MFLPYTAVIVPVQICLWDYSNSCNKFPTLYFDVLVDAFFKPKEAHLNAFAPNPELPRPAIELADKRRHFNYDGIFDKELLKLNAD